MSRATGEPDFDPADAAGEQPERIAPETTTTGETNPLIAMSARVDPWLQDLIRRAYTQGRLSAADISAGLDLLKRDKHIDIGAGGIEAEPLTAAHLRPTTTTALPVVLNALAEARSVNRLADDQELNFAVTGVTVIYGDNASGKSGYTRLLKRLCRTRSGAREPILSDVFATVGGFRPRAEVRFTIGGGAVQSAIWQEGDDPPADLSRLSVFDARSIPIYADQHNEMEFLPYHLDVLPEVARGMQHMAELLEVEILASRRVLERAFPVDVRETSAEARVRGLTTEAPADELATAAEITELASLSVDEREELRVLRLALAEHDPRAAGARRTEATRFRAIAERLIPAEQLLSDEAIGRLSALRDEATAAAMAADMAASEAFSGEPFPGAGTDAWRRMYGYARDFYRQADQVHEFPPSHQGAVCPLCMQELGPDAVDRFARFRTICCRSCGRRSTPPSRLSGGGIGPYQGPRSPVT